MLKYNFDELSDKLHREVDYSYFLYNVQDFDVNLIDIPEIDKITKKNAKEVIKNENSEEEYDDDYELKVDNINENNVNINVTKGAHKLAPAIEDETKVTKRYMRNPLLGKIAIINACYCCEKNKNHETFISKKTNKNFMEAHHLVPVKYQQQIWNKYHINVDCAENIISLCPTCHRAFHNGTNEIRKTMITDLYKKLLPKYKSIGFNISLNEILELYNIKL